MTIPKEFADAVLLLGIGAVLFSILILSSKKESSSSNRVALVILLFGCIRFIGILMRSTVHLHGIPVYLFFDIKLFFVDGILIYWFSSTLLDKNFNWRFMWPHLLPIPFIMITAVYPLFTIPLHELNKLYFSHAFAQESNAYETNYIQNTLISIIVFHNGFYLFLSFKKLKQYRSVIKNQFSSLSKINLNWLLKLLITWFCLLWIPLAIMSFSLIDHSFDYLGIRNLFVICIVSITIYFGYHATLQKYQLVESGDIKNNNKAKKSFKENEEEQLEGLASTFRVLESYMTEYKPFLDPELSLGELAKRVNIKPHLLSMVINRKFESNFFDFINQYRIKEVCKELKSTSDPIMIIAYRCGFNSKSTFNAVFKKFTNMTPTAFRKQKSH
ncbi:helix-turn-helix domain-containing protein [Xanthovirga aplysinae]|uniref:helix-turn-helix domain-containing protein n=1 Tax=Xanthovirga aplysinae TaxID=2529853 RepID=UPI0012BBE962|nr:AraC family transcriptional regulator [Xanthovirga aplysinae]MTI32177.1 AraC family transcriptional regulator [Xanthovirga aplysinae]